MKRFEKHIFVCENVRPEDHPRGCCYGKGGKDLRELFKDRLKQLGLNSWVRANSAGCLDACEFGMSVVIYPDPNLVRQCKAGKRRRDHSTTYNK